MALHLLVADHRLIGTAFGGESPFESNAIVRRSQSPIPCRRIFRSSHHFPPREAKRQKLTAVWRAFNNSGSVIMDVSFGRIQDATPEMSYDRVLKLTIGLKSLAFALGVGYIFMDRYKLASGLTMTRKRRDAVEDDIPASEREAHPLFQRRAVLKLTVGGFCLLVDSNMRRIARADERRD